jgi:glycerophosphoryl diester phosphodiesterase
LDSPIALIRQAGKESNVLFKPRVPKVGDPMRRPVDQLTLAELRANYGYQTLDGDPVSAVIPSFGDFVAWARAEPRLQTVLLDIKVPDDKAELTDALIDKVEEILKTAEAPFQRVYTTPHKHVWEIISRKVEDSGLSFDVDLGLTPVSEGSCRAASSRRALERGRGYATSVHPTSWGREDWKKLKALVKCDLDARDKNANHGRITKVYAATLDEKDKMRCLMNMGIDGLVTDHPSTLEDLASWMRH